MSHRTSVRLGQISLGERICTEKYVPSLVEAASVAAPTSWVRSKMCMNSRLGQCCLAGACHERATSQTSTKFAPVSRSGTLACGVATAGNSGRPTRARPCHGRCRLKAPHKHRAGSPFTCVFGPATQDRGYSRAHRDHGPCRAQCPCRAVRRTHGRGSRASRRRRRRCHASV